MEHSKKLLTLDVLRGLACFVVWLSHIRVATQYFNDPKYDFIQSFVAWGREAVVIFFMLSGIVINLATQNKTDRWEYFKKRFIRIYPIYLGVLIICFSADYFIFGNALNKATLIGNLFLVATWPKFVAATMPLNTAVWSIACEAFFYVIFGLIYKPRRLTGIWIWFALCLLSIVFRIFHAYHLGVFYLLVFMLNGSFLWVLGYLVFEYRDRICSNINVAFCGLLMVPLVTRLNTFPTSLRQITYFAVGLYLVPLFAYLLRDYKIVPNEKRKIYIRHIYFVPIYGLNLFLLWRYSDSLLISKILYCSIPLLSLVFYSNTLSNAVKWAYNKIKAPFLLLARVSYPLYLLHMPVMYIVFHYLPTQKFAGMALAVIVTLSLAYLFEILLFEKLTFLTRKSPESKTAN